MPIHSDIWSLLLALNSKIISVWLGEPYGVLRFEPWLATYKSSALPTALKFYSLNTLSTCSHMKTFWFGSWKMIIAKHHIYDFIEEFFSYFETQFSVWLEGFFGCSGLLDLNSKKNVYWGSVTISDLDHFLFIEFIQIQWEVLNIFFNFIFVVVVLFWATPRDAQRLALALLSGPISGITWDHVRY